MLNNRIEVYQKYKDDKQALKQQKYRLPADYKEEYPWLKEVDSLALANAQLNLEQAYQNFFRDKSVGFPKFKSKHHSRKSYTTNNQKGTIRLIDSKTIRLPKLGNVHLKLHRPIPEDYVIKSATISRTPTGKYDISILVEYTAEIPMVNPTIDTVIGLDYSSGSLIVDHMGNKPDYPGYYRKAEAKLKKEQRKLSKRKVGGKNREKQRQKVAKLHEKVANQRRDFLHKLSRQITNAYDAVAIEDINMRNIAQLMHLAKSTNDNGYGKLKSFLNYKLVEQGKHLVVIDKWYPSSKTCYHCKYKNANLTLEDRVWTSISASYCETCNKIIIDL